MALIADNTFIIIAPYLITFFGSLVVALIAVWYSQNLPEKRAYEQLHENLLTEIRDNIERCEHLPELINKDLEQFVKNEESLFGMPLFYDDIWKSLRIRGQLYRIATEGRDLYRKLKMLYEQIDMTNRLLLYYEERKIEPIFNVNEYKEEQSRRVRGVKCNIMKNIRPLLADVETLLNEKIRQIKAIK